MEKEFYSTDEFAKLLSISQQKVREMISNNTVKAIKISEGSRSRFRIPATEIMRLRSLAYEDCKESSNCE